MTLSYVFRLTNFCHAERKKYVFYFHILLTINQSMIVTLHTGHIPYKRFTCNFYSAVNLQIFDLPVYLM